MNKGEWYKFLFKQADEAIVNGYFFEAAFISYGIIEDRLNSLMDIYTIPIGRKGVAAKIKALAKVRSTAAENLLQFKSWDGGKYKNHGGLSETLAWGELYRNPMQHHLGDPRNYKSTIGDFHNQNTKDLAVEGVRVARELSSTLMRYKKHRHKFQ